MFPDGAVPASNSRGKQDHANPPNPCMKYEVQAGLTKTKKEKMEQKSNLTIRKITEEIKIDKLRVIWENKLALRENKGKEHQILCLIVTIKWTIILVHVAKNKIWLNRSQVGE